MNKIIATLCLIGSVMYAGLLQAESQDVIAYELEVTNADQHYAEITVLFPTTSQEYLDVVMPSWRLGKYQVLNLANGIRDLSASDSSGTELPVKKIDKNTWRIFLHEPTKIVVTYELYANQLKTRTRHIDDTHAYLDGVSTFIYAPTYIENPVEIKLNVPKGWRSRSGMERKGRHTFKTDSYHTLASSPIESGFHEFYEFEVDDKNIEVVIWGKGNFKAERILADFEKLIKTQGQLWGSYPFEKYVFIIHVSDGLRGGTEHINSTVMQMDAMGFDSEAEYFRFLGLTSHEFVHTWNVKAYRPTGIQQYDYTTENYSDLLWISEGSTSYLGDLLLARSEVVKLKQYFEKFAKAIKEYEDSPGRHRMTAQQASFNTWIEGRGHRGMNDSVDIYNKGRMLTLLMDMTLIEDSEGKATVGDLHRLLYERFPAPEKGFTANDVKSIMTELTGEDYSDFWSTYMEGTREINIAQLLKSVGLNYIPDGKPTESSNPVFNTGIKFHSSNSNTIQSVRRDSASWKAGLTEADEIIAINGVKLGKGKWQDILSSYEDGQEVQVTFFRRNVLKETTLELVSRRMSQPVIEHVEDPTEQQKEYYKVWLGLDWPDEG